MNNDKNSNEKIAPPVELTDDEMEQASGGKKQGGKVQKCGNCGINYEIKYTDGQPDPCPHCGN